ncbi:MAG: 5'-methylthioadenosine/adenosylhomocysteine nucleosidase [Clostridiales bacterium]|nr:5'-methylthioadenosine/adenosylhomocysteine nucleosidase [Clostridiales bacterium]
MRIGILCAGDREAAPFLPLIENEKITQKAMLTFHEGILCGVSVVVLYSGVCKVNAAIAAQILIDTFGVEVILNAGTAGGMDPRLALFDVVISTEVAYHDVAPHILTEFHPWMDSVFFQADPRLVALSKRAVSKLTLKSNVYWGRMVTGEAFIADEGRQAINRQFSPLSVDMETASIAHVCYANRIPFLSIRSMTDNASHSGEGHFEENCDKAANIAKEVTVAVLELLKA